MARKAKSATEEPETTDSTRTTEAAPGTATGAGGETVAGYFRQVFKENPKLLKERSNEVLYTRWLRDHPGHAEVPPQVKANLQNLKSVLRKNLGKKKAARQEAAAKAQPETAAPVASAPARVSTRHLETLERQIDDCLVFARGLDQQDFEDVILLLRRARNIVVRRLDQ